MDREDLDLCRLLHQRARRGGLTDAESRVYRDGVERAFRKLLEVQNGDVPPKMRKRGDVRIRRVTPVEVRYGEQRHRAVTLDLGLGGFSTLLGQSPPRGEAVTVEVQLPGAKLVTEARVVDTRERRGALRVSFRFERLGEAERSSLQAGLVEDALAHVAMVLPPDASSPRVQPPILEPVTPIERAPRAPQVDRAAARETLFRY